MQEYDNKSKAQLISELEEMRQRIIELEAIPDDSKQTNEQLMRKTEDLTLVNLLNDAANRESSLKEIIELLCQETNRLFSGHGVTIYLLSEDKETLTVQNLNLPKRMVKAVEQLIGQNLPPIRIPLREGSLFLESFTTGQSRIVNDAKTIQGYFAEFTDDKTLKKLVPRIYRMLGIRSLMYVPLISDSQAIGLMDIGRREPFTEEDRQRLETIAGQMTNIIKRKQTEEALRESGEKYRNLVERANDGVCIIQDGLVKYANWRQLEMWGGDAIEEIIDTPFVNYVHPDDLPWVVERYKRRMAGEQVPSVYQATLMRKDGSKAYVELNVGIINYLGKPAELVITRDITERKRAEQALKESEEVKRAVMNATPDLIAVIDEKGILHDSNVAMAKRFGLQPEEIISGYGWNLVSPDLAKSRRGYFEKVFQTGQPLRFEDERGGAYFDNIVYPIRQEEGKVTRVAINARDITERKRTEEKYQTILNKALDGFVIIDLDANLLEVNDSYCEMSGYTREELLKMSVADIDVLSSPEDIAERIRKVIPIKHEYFETKHKRKDGRIIDVEVSSNYLDINEGQFFIFLRDITERKRAEEALRESEEKYRAIFEEAADSIVLVDPQTQGLVDFNDRACESLGYTRQEFKELKVPDFEALESTEDTAKHLEAVLKEERQLFETKHRTKSGEIRDVQVNTKVISVGGSRLISSIFHDITERKRADQALRESEVRLRTIGNSIPEIIMVLDEDGRYIDVLTGDENLLYRNKESVIGHRLHDVLPKDVADIRLESIRRAIKTDTSQTLEYRLSVPAGESWFEGRITPLPLAGAQKKLVVMVSRDITEHKMLEEERQRAAKLESIGTLAGGIAHDFNNILTGIMGYIGLARRQVKSNEKAYEWLGEAEKASVRAKDLTQQLLTFARGGLPVKKLTSIAELVRESATFALQGSNVRPEFSFPDDLYSVEIDEGQMNQVIQNLIINADEAMPVGGVINIKAKNVTIHRALNLPLPRGHYVKITIKDYGVGIPKELLPRIFEPYFTTKQKGSGLGLATTYSIIKNHGGHITVESRQEIGTSFHIYLPAVTKPAPAKKANLAEILSRSTGKILVMDDEELVRDFLYSELTEIGYQVELAEDGNSALELYTKARESGQPFAVVILDLTVPGGKGGKETIKELLEIDPSVKAIVSSGYATDPIMSDYKKYGFSAVVTKPYNIADLENALHTILTRKK